MIKAFLFDNNGVITKGGMGNGLSNRLGANLGITPEEAWLLVQPEWHSFLCGTIAGEELWAKVEKSCGQVIGPEKRNIWDTWDDGMKPQPQMMQLVQRLRKDFRVGLFTNVIPPTAKMIYEHNGYDGFDFTLLSCEVGLAKPDPQMYQLALRKLAGISPESVVLLDDQERFLVPARELGIQTILVESAEQAIRDVDDLLGRTKHATNP